MALSRPRSLFPARAPTPQNSLVDCGNKPSSAKLSELFADSYASISGSRAATVYLPKPTFARGLKYRVRHGEEITASTAAGKRPAKTDLACILPISSFSTSFQAKIHKAFGTTATADSTAQPAAFGSKTLNVANPNKPELAAARKRTRKPAAAVDTAEPASKLPKVLSVAAPAAPIRRAKVPAGTTQFTYPVPVPTPAQPTTSRQASKSLVAPSLHRTQLPTINKSRGAANTRSAPPATVKSRASESRAFNLGQTLLAVEQFVDIITTDPNIIPDTIPTASAPPTPTYLVLDIPGLSSLPKLFIAPLPVLSLRPIQRHRRKSPRPTRSHFDLAIEAIVKQCANDQQLANDRFIADVLKVAQG